MDSDSSGGSSLIYVGLYGNSMHFIWKIGGFRYEHKKDREIN